MFLSALKLLSNLFTRGAKQPSDMPKILKTLFIENKTEDVNFEKSFVHVLTSYLLCSICCVSHWGRRVSSPQNLDLRVEVRNGVNAGAMIVLGKSGTEYF